MSTQPPKFICDTNLSYAWGEALINIFDNKKDDLCPLIISLTGFKDGLPEEAAAIRKAIDSSLIRHGRPTCAISASTIFPFRQWKHVASTKREVLYDWYLKKLLPRLKKRCPANQYGTYFERMIAFQGMKKANRIDKVRTVNQLEHIIRDWTKKRSHPKRPRHSALQVVCFDPAKDHTGQSVRGFPCLQQVSVAYDANGGMALNAYYPTQYMHDRAYGNYLGLCALGRFMANAMGLNLVRFNCFVGHPELGDVRKTDIQKLIDVIRESLESRMPENRNEGTEEKQHNALRERT